MNEFGKTFKKINSQLTDKFGRKKTKKGFKLLQSDLLATPDRYQPHLLRIAKKNEELGKGLGKGLFGERLGKGLKKGKTKTHKKDKNKIDDIMKKIETRKKKDTVKTPDFSGLISYGITQIKDLVNTVKSSLPDKKGSDGNKGHKKLDQNIFYEPCPKKKCSHTIRKCKICRLLKDMSIITYRNNLGAFNVDDCLSHPDQLIYIWRIVVPTTNKKGHNLQLGDYSLYKLKKNGKDKDIVEDYISSDKDNSLTKEENIMELKGVDGSIPTRLNDEVFYPLMKKYNDTNKNNRYPQEWNTFLKLENTKMENTRLHDKILKNRSHIMKLNKKK